MTTILSQSSPLFINTNDYLSKFFRSEKKSFFQTTFYKQQRKKLNILLDEDDKPEGGKWTYDSDNRKKYPKGKTPPTVHFPEKNQFWDEAVNYTDKHFKNNLGKLSESPIYPTDHKQAEDWFEQFLDYRFYDFGSYEDAIVKQESFLNHSILTPMLNVGLIQTFLLKSTLEEMRG